jgi:uncharacterized protein (DUF697 family)
MQIAALLEYENRSSSALASAADKAAKLVNMANYAGMIDQLATLVQPLIEKSVEGADWLAQKTVASAEVSLSDLETLDSLADSTHNRAIAAASALGGAAGVAGLPGLAADIAGIVTLAMRTVRQVGACYGHNDMSQEDVMKIVSMATGGSQREKMITLVGLRQAHTMASKTTFKAMATAGPQGLAILAVREFAKSVGVNLTKRKILQIIPLVGAAVGLAMNAAYMRDIGWTARRYFQRSWLEDRGKLAAVVPTALT